jgi:Flp pilus assembly protein TadG
LWPYARQIKDEKNSEPEMKNILSRLKNKKGQSTVEFALVAILLLIIVFGIIVFGMAWYRADLLKGAANVGARTYAVTKDMTAATNAAQGVAGAGALVSFGIGTISVTATVSQPFRMLAPGLLSMVSITNISRSATYRLE